MASDRIKTSCGVTVKLWHGDDCDGCKRIKYLIVRGDSPLQPGERIRRDSDGAVFVLDRHGIDPDIGSGWFVNQGGFISDEALASPWWTVLPATSTEAGQPTTEESTSDSDRDEAVLAVQNGEVLTITRHGREVAVLMGVDMYDALKSELGLDGGATPEAEENR